MRYEELLDRVVEGAAQAMDHFDVDQFDHLVRHAGVPSKRFRDELAKHVRSKTRRDAEAQLDAMQMPEKLAEIDSAERRAWDRRAKIASDPANASPYDLPVQLSDLSMDQLVDCQLLQPREQWLAELEQRKRQATSSIEVLGAELERKRGEMRNKLVLVEQRLQQLRSVEQALRGPAGA